MCIQIRALSELTEHKECEYWKVCTVHPTVLKVLRCKMFSRCPFDQNSEIIRILVMNLLHTRNSIELQYDWQCSLFINYTANSIRESMLVYPYRYAIIKTALSKYHFEEIIALFVNYLDLSAKDDEQILESSIYPTATGRPTQCLECAPHKSFWDVFSKCNPHQFLPTLLFEPQFLLSNLVEI